MFVPIVDSNVLHYCVLTNGALGADCEFIFSLLALAVHLLSRSSSSTFRLLHILLDAADPPTIAGYYSVSVRYI